MKMPPPIIEPTTMAQNIGIENLPGATGIWTAMSGGSAAQRRVERHPVLKRRSAKQDQLLFGGEQIPFGVEHFEEGARRRCRSEGQRARPSGAGPSTARLLGEDLLVQAAARRRSPSETSRNASWTVRW